MLENLSFQNDERIAALELSLQEAQMIAEDSDRKYDEVKNGKKLLMDAFVSLFPVSGNASEISGPDQTQSETAALPDYRMSALLVVACCVCILVLTNVSPDLSSLLLTSFTGYEFGFPLSEIKM